jgi:hypothetical protein
MSIHFKGAKEKEKGKVRRKSMKYYHQQLEKEHFTPGNKLLWMKLIV